MLEFSKRYNFSFPYLFDSTQNVAKAYKAACTPDFFLFDKGHNLFYRGQMDSSRPGNQVVSDGSDIRESIQLMITGFQPKVLQTPSLGCNIKWKKGCEPSYLETNMIICIYFALVYE